MTAQPYRQPEVVTEATGRTAGGTDHSPESERQPTAKRLPARGDFLDLRIWAESYADVQQNRIALVNRMERGGIDGDLLAGHRAMLEASENAFRLSMVRSYRRTVRQSMPDVEAWQKGSFGIGEHLLARLLGTLGHPVIATPYAWMDDALDGHVCIPERCGKRHLVAFEPYRRTLRQLWSYCGHGAPVRRRKGMSQEDAFGLGSPRCKMLVHLLAEGTIKCGPQPISDPTAMRAAAGATLPPKPWPLSIAKENAASGDSSPPKTPSEAIRVTAGSGSGASSIAVATAAARSGKYRYRNIYDRRREATVDREWTPGHSHADALRIVGKEILRDLWQTAGGGA